MATSEQRAQGTTPDLHHVNARRTADRQGAFLLSHLKPGMSLIDVGCGPGTITAGFAEAVAPGPVVGIDHDQPNVAAATVLASERRARNLTFAVGDVHNLPHEDRTFDVAFENNLFIHLPDPVVAAKEIFRVLKPGGAFAARDTMISIWDSNLPLVAREATDHFKQWMGSRGSRISGFGAELPAVLREAGFIETAKTASSDTLQSLEGTRSSARTWEAMLRGALGEYLMAGGLADRTKIDEYVAAWRAWGENPDSFHANVHIEVIGHRPS